MQAPQSGTVVTDHKMIFSISPRQTTLYDQVEYQGSPSSFAWVLPIHGSVTVGLSSDSVFAAVEQSTPTTIVAPYLPPCPPPPYCSCGGSAGFGGGSGGGGSASPSSGGSAGGTSGPPPVTVIARQVVGPYETVQLQSAEPNALETWLTTNGYSVPADVQPIVAAYVGEGFDFLAMRLAPGQGVQAMRPVSVTSAGAGLSLPLRMVAAGTGATVGITLWIVSSGRYEPQNFPTFVVSSSDLVWDWSLGDSNYATVRARREASWNNAAWQIESSLDLSPVLIESPILNTPATYEYDAISASDAGVDGANVGQTADQMREQDLARLFSPGFSTVRITRMRADLSRAALARDLILQASADQRTLSNFVDVTSSVNAPVCPTYDSCPPCSGAANSGTNSSTDGVPPNARGACAVTQQTAGSARGGGDVVLLGLLAAAASAKRRGSRRC
jgi:hypothetical protein